MAARLAGAGGRGRFQLGQNSEMNVTPFVDVMLVLLIVFMVAAPIATTAIKVDMPPNGPASRLGPPTYVSISNDGQLYISVAGGVPRHTSLDRLGADLGRWLNPQTQQILIRADQHVRYAKFMAVIDRLQNDGFAKVSLISEEVQPGA